MHMVRICMFRGGGGIEFCSCRTSGTRDNSPMKTSEPFKRNPLSSLPEIKLVPVPDPITLTHEPRMPLRSYLSRPDDPLRSLAEALSGRGRTTKIEVEKPARSTEPEMEEAEEAAPASAAPPMRWGRQV